MTTSPEEEYAAVHKVGVEFTGLFYGRLNATRSAGSVADVFAERVRFFAMDASESRPAVGRAAAVDALKRFCRTTSGGGGRYVSVVSVDARVDDDGPGDPRYELFVRAEWTSPSPAAAHAVPSTPFVQTFRVRRPRDLHGPFEVLSTTVRTMREAAADHAPVPPPQSPTKSSPPKSPLRSPPSTRDREYTVDSNVGATTIAESPGPSGAVRPPGPSVVTASTRPSGNVGFPGLSSTTASAEPSGTVGHPRSTTGPVRPPGTAASAEPSGTCLPRPTVTRFPQSGDGNRRDTRADWRNGRRGGPSRRQEFETYQQRVRAFLEGTSGFDGRARDDEPAARLLVDDLDAACRADDLYAAFGRFGEVLWVRIVPADDDARAAAACRGRVRGSRGPVRHVGYVCFERPDALTRALDEQCRARGCLVRGRRLPVKRFVECGQ